MACSVMGCDLASRSACLASRAKMYVYQERVFCERHYLEASQSGRPDSSRLVWDFERGYSPMFPGATNADAALAMARK